MYVLCGNSLAPSLMKHFERAVSRSKSLELLPASLGKFKSSESFAEILRTTDSDLGGNPVCIIQSLAATKDHSANDYAMQLLMTIRTLKRNNAGAIWVIMPFMAYARQDRPFGGRMTSIGIDDFAAMLKEAGATGVSSIELHSPASLKFLEDRFGKDNVFHLQPTKLFVDFAKEKLKEQSLAVGGPDAGANARADAVRAALGASSFKIQKVHTGTNETRVTNFQGDVCGKTTLTIDDMKDTCGTITNAQRILEEQGSKARITAAAHGIFSEGGLEKLFTAKANDDNTPLVSYIVTTDTIDNSEKIARLKAQYGSRAVDRRVKILSVGSMIIQHITNDILNHPAIK